MSTMSTEETPDLLNVLDDIKEQKNKLETAEDEHKLVQDRLDKLKISLDTMMNKKNNLKERKTSLQEKYRTNKQTLEKIFLAHNKYNMNKKCLQGHKERLIAEYGKTLNIVIKKEKSGLNNKLVELRKRKDELWTEIGENNTKLEAIFAEKRIIHL